MVGGGGWVGGSQRLLCLNPTTLIVVLLLGLWFLLGCDNQTLSLVFSYNEQLKNENITSSKLSESYQVKSGEDPHQHAEEKQEKVENAPGKRRILRGRKLDQFQPVLSQ